jgi:hypothetical protein
MLLHNFVLMPGDLHGFLCLPMRRLCWTKIAAAATSGLVEVARTAPDNRVLL